MAVASLSNGASVVIASSSEERVKLAVQSLKEVIQTDGITVTGQAFDMRDTPALTKFLSDNGPFDHLVRRTSLSRLWVLMAML